MTKNESYVTSSNICFFLKIHNYVSCCKNLEKVNTHIYINYYLKAKYKRTISKQYLYPSLTGGKIVTYNVCYTLLIAWKDYKTSKP